MDGKKQVFCSVSGLEESGVNKCTAFVGRERSSGNVTQCVVKDVS